MSIKLQDGATIVLRFGGWGDLFPVIAVARWMLEKYPDRPVDCAVRGREQVEFCASLGVFRNSLQQVEEVGQRWVDWELGVEGAPRTMAPLHRLSDAYDRVIDFRDTVENNPYADHGNWYDLSFAYADLDPTEVPPEFKRPLVKLPDKAGDRANQVMDSQQPAGTRAGALCLAGSSPLRSLPREFWEKVVSGIREYDSEIRFYVLSSPNKAELAPQGPGIVNLIGKTSMMESAAVLARCDVAVCADTGLAHFADGLGVRCVTAYTTVKGWTRAQYHACTEIVDSGVDCQCAVLQGSCPRLRDEVLAGLNGHQRQIYHARHIQPIPDPVIAERLGIPPPQYAQEGNVTERVRRSVEGQFAECVRAVSVEKVVNLAVESLRDGSNSADRECAAVPEALAAV